METGQLRVLHLPKYPPRKGGMDELLRIHAKQGESVYGLLTHHNGQSIGFNTWIPFQWQKDKLAKLEQISTQHDVSLYYNCWGADIFSKYDKATQRIGYIHNHFPNFDQYIRHFAAYLDGFLTVNPATTRCIQKLLRHTHPTKNTQTIPLPINPPKQMPTVKKENIIGLVGRINYEQKRYDRLPEFAKILAKRIPDMRIEVLGEGPEKSNLIKATKNIPQVHFLPWCRGYEYWKILSRWKFILFLSDYEGMPISLLEAIHAGCKAIYPDFHRGDNQNLPLHLYPLSDLEAIVKLITQCGEKPQDHKQISPLQYARILPESLAEVKKIKVSNNLPNRLKRSASYNKEYKHRTLRNV